MNQDLSAFILTLPSPWRQIKWAPSAGGVDFSELVSIARISAPLSPLFLLHLLFSAITLNLLTHLAIKNNQITIRFFCPASSSINRIKANVALSSQPKFSQAGGTSRPSLEEINWSRSLCRLKQPEVGACLFFCSKFNCGNPQSSN